MSMNQRNTIVSLACFLLTLLYMGIRVIDMVQTETFALANVISLWITVTAAVIIITIVGTIAANIVYGIFYTIANQKEPEKPEYTTDERDNLIDLKGTKVAYLVNSLGVLAAMATFALNQPPLVMFTGIIAAALVSNIAGDVYRLTRYGRGA